MPKQIDTIYRTKKTLPPKKRSNKQYWPYFYKSLQIVLTVWIVTVLAIITQPWLDYWVKNKIKPTDYRLQSTAQNILGSTSDNAVDGSPSAVSETTTFHLQNSQVDIHAPIVEGVEEEDLKKGIGHHPESVWPDTKGNVVLAGHNFDLDPENPYGKVFFELREVSLGDKVTIDYQDKKYTYEIFNQETVEPDDTSLFGQTDDWLLTFYTCDPPYTDWKRLVFQGKLIRIE